MARNSHRGRPLLLIGLVGLTMAGLAAFAVVPHPGLANGRTETPGALTLAAPADEIALLPTGTAPAAAPPQDPQPALRPALPARPILIEKAQASAAAPAAVSGGGVEELALDCMSDAAGRRLSMPLDTLVRIVSARIDSLGAGATADAIHLLVQADLFRSGDGAPLKQQAIAQLKARYAQDQAASAALGQPFDLSQKIAGIGVDFSPCAGPVTLGGASGFEKGPFAGEFVTVNPLPVIATRLASTGEGRQF